MRIRPPRTGELARLQDIERAAGKCFADIGMPEIAGDEPLSLAELGRFLAAGLAWVAAAEPDAPVAYLIAEPVDGNLHIEQVSVHPDHARKRIGKALLDRLADHAVDSGVSALTLTTFTEVPWNAPYYARCGFEVLDQNAVGPELARIRRQEAAHGLDRWPRVCMRRLL